MKKKARRSSAPNRSNKKNSSDSGCLWSAIKAILMIAFWPFTLIYWIISALTGAKSAKSSNSSVDFPVQVKPVPTFSGTDTSATYTASCSVNNTLHNKSNDDEYQAVGLYKPTFVFSTVDGYKDKLKNVRDRQREMVHDKTACIVPTKFTYNGSVTEGNRLVNDWMRLMLRAFNGECDVIIDHVSFLNFDSSKEKMKLERELQERRAKIIKDQKHDANELSALSSRLESATPEESATIQSRIAELNEYTQKLQSDLDTVAQREQQARAGYVYIISNIGSFGKNVYKIGMTRRLDPQDRVDELGDASVPFRFDVHAFIFSEDAVTLENALHNAFASRRVNLVNLRREFFHVTLDEIEACVKQNFSETVEFTRTATAQEYRESETIRAEQALAIATPCFIPPDSFNQ